MGTHTRASNELNVARVGATELFANHNELVCDADDRKADPASDPASLLHGWRLCRGKKAHYKGDLYPESYTGPKGELVHVLNTDQYASVGENDWVVFGPDAKHVRAFLKSCGFKGIRIAKTEIVQQTL